MAGNSRKLGQIIAALFAGLLFGAGLLVGGMTQPSKVIGFLDFAGAWDPSLAFVMAGAIGVFLPLFRLIQRRSAPLFDAAFSLPTKTDLDSPLVLGAALFGAGWGLAGYCPGPALTALGSLTPPAFVFAGSMFAGFAMKRVWDRRSEPAIAQLDAQAAE